MTFTDYRQSIKSKFSRNKKRTIEELKAITQFFYWFKDKITAKNLQKQLSITIWLTSLKSRLKLMVEKWILSVSGKKRTYIRDIINDKPRFWWDIGNAFREWLEKLLHDASKRVLVMKIMENKIVSYTQLNNIDIPIKIQSTEDITYLFANYLQNKQQIPLYNEIIKEIKYQLLFDSSNWYDELQRQNFANKYVSNIE